MLIYRLMHQNNQSYYFVEDSLSIDWKSFVEEIICASSKEYRRLNPRQVRFRPSAGIIFVSLQVALVDIVKASLSS